MRVRIRAWTKAEFKKDNSSNQTEFIPSNLPKNVNNLKKVAKKGVLQELSLKLARAKRLEMCSMRVARVRVGGIRSQAKTHQALNLGKREQGLVREITAWQ